MGGRGPSSPNRPNGLLRGSESPNIGAPHISDLGSGGATRSAAPSGACLRKAGLCVFADPEPRRGSFGPLG
eukprot:14614631-Alexandrium_andersonii.AAC.1